MEWGGRLTAALRLRIVLISTYSQSYLLAVCPLSTWQAIVYSYTHHHIALMWCSFAPYVYGFGLAGGNLKPHPIEVETDHISIVSKTSTIL